MVKFIIQILMRIIRLVKLRNEYLEQTGRTQRVKYLRNLIHGQVTHSVEGESESSDDEAVGSYIPAGLAAMLSGVARATMKQTIPGVTVRSRADYKNLKVAVSLESMTDDNASTAASNTDMNGVELPSTSFAKHLELQGGLSLRQEQIVDKIPKVRITTPSPESSEEEQDISQEPVPKGSKAMMRRLRDKFKEMTTLKTTLLPLRKAETATAGRFREAALRRNYEHLLVHIRDLDCSVIEVRYQDKCFKAYTNPVFYNSKTDG
ncbi:Hypothetical predicted protein [Paramuricea clavata]|uniref:Uncharacterized protein n=1 Tax=Paramuricea clavata TaxID=317549 RepID=A0A6S7IC39_PARCT|nr:Hypothetical predicted protein [Paramuricea clavata]